MMETKPQAGVQTAAALTLTLSQGERESSYPLAPWERAGVRAVSDSADS